MLATSIAPTANQVLTEVISTYNFRQQNRKQTDLQYRKLTKSRDFPQMARSTSVIAEEADVGGTSGFARSLISMRKSGWAEVLESMKC